MLARVSRTKSTATASTPQPEPIAALDAEAAPDRPWWRDAVVYQVYVRSFADANGDGIGDLAGVLARLPYLRELGVDALWFNPWYPSPMADSGYDIADYRSIDPAFGTLDEAERLIAEARVLGRVGRARALLVPSRRRAGRLEPAERLAVDLRRARLDARRRRHGRAG